MRCNKDTSFDFQSSGEGCEQSLGVRYNLAPGNAQGSHVHFWLSKKHPCVTPGRALTRFKLYANVVSASWDWEPTA